MTVNATDADSGRNAEIVYTLMHPIKGITIDQTTGTIFANRTALALPEGTKDIELAVVAQDLGTPPLRDVAAVTLRISDERGLAPQFTQEEYQ